MTSRTTRSGLFSDALVIALCPSAATETANPANRRDVASSSRMLGSSSTTRRVASGVLTVSVTVTVSDNIL